MANYPKKLRQCKGVLRTLGLVCVTLGLAVHAAAECTTKTYTLDVPDATTLKLKDGDHTVAAVATEHGKLEARVTVKGKVVSEPRLFIGGKLLKEISESQILEPVRGCAQKAGLLQKAGLSAESWIARVVYGALNWIMPTAYARTEACIYKVTAFCGKALDGSYYCIYYVCCGSKCTWQT